MKLYIPYIVFAFVFLLFVLSACAWWRERGAGWALAATVNGLCSMLYALAISSNLSAGCYPWSPADIEFYQGMTICPGQAAHGTFGLTEPLH